MKKKKRPSPRARRHNAPESSIIIWTLEDQSFPKQAENSEEIRGVSKHLMPAKNHRRPQAVPPTPANSSLLGPEKLKQLYSAMLQCRMIKEKTRAVIHQPLLVQGRQAHW